MSFFYIAVMRHEHCTLHRMRIVLNVKIADEEKIINGDRKLISLNVNLK